MGLTHLLRGKDFSEDTTKQNSTTCCIKETHLKEILKIKNERIGKVTRSKRMQKESKRAGLPPPDMIE